MRILNNNIAISAVIAIMSLLSAFAWGSIYAQGRPVAADSSEYLSLAQSLRTLGVFGGGDGYATESPSMWREPAYPTFLALLLPLGRFFDQGLFVAQSILFALSAVALFYASHAFITRPLAIIAALTYGILPSTAYRAGYIGTDMPLMIMTVFAFAAALATSRREARSIVILGSGILAGLLPLIRSSALFICVPFILFFVVARVKRKTILIWSVGFCAIIVPWMIRNMIYFQTPAISNRAGYVLFVRTERSLLPPEHKKLYLISSFAGDLITQTVAPSYTPELKPTIEGRARQEEKIRTPLRNGSVPSVLDKELLNISKKTISDHPLSYAAFFIPEMARLNAPIIPRASIQSLFFPTTEEQHKTAKIIFVLLLRLLSLAIAALIFIRIYRAMRTHNSPALMLAGMLVIYFNVIYAAFAALERFSLPLYPFYSIFGWLVVSEYLSRVTRSRFMSSPNSAKGS